MGSEMCIRDSLKRENSNLEDQLSVMADEIAKMKEMLLEQSKKPAATDPEDETVQSLEFTSNGFDDFERLLAKNLNA